MLSSPAQQGVSKHEGALTEVFRFNARASGGDVFWLGVVSLAGSPGGVGFVEMTGYPVVAEKP